VRSIDLARDRAVRVLVAEVAEPPGRLSSLIERAGHRVVARAATADELAHLVQLARPEVAVFDAELSAETVAAFRASEPAVGVVVVWPEGATAELADEQVSPARIQQDLAGAVRRAAPVPAAAATGPASLPAASSGPTSGGTSWLGRGGLELAVAATLTFLLVVTAVAFRVAQGEGITFAGAPTGTSPSAPVPGTNEPVVPPEPPSGPAADRATVVGGAQRNSPRAAAGDAASSPLVGGEPGSAEPGSAGPRSTEPGPVSSIPGGAVAVRPANGPTIFARYQACRQATAQLGIVGAGASLRRLLHRCVVTESAGLLRALARLVGTGGPGRSAAHRGGPGDAPSRGAAHHRRDGSGHHETSSGHGHSSNGHGSDDRPTGSDSGHGNGNSPGNGHGHGNGPGHGPGNGHGHGHGHGPGHGRVGSHVPGR
jgi:hypothetical protein